MSILFIGSGEQPNNLVQHSGYAAQPRRAVPSYHEAVFLFFLQSVDFRRQLGYNSCVGLRQSITYALAKVGE
jgi:hypothetical protein